MDWYVNGGQCKGMAAVARWGIEDTSLFKRYRNAGCSDGPWNRRDLIRLDTNESSSVAVTANGDCYVEDRAYEPVKLEIRDVVDAKVVANPSASNLCAVATKHDVYLFSMYPLAIECRKQVRVDYPIRKLLSLYEHVQEHAELLLLTDCRSIVKVFFSSGRIQVLHEHVDNPTVRDGEVYFSRDGKPSDRCLALPVKKWFTLRGIDIVLGEREAVGKGFLYLSTSKVRDITAAYYGRLYVLYHDDTLVLMSTQGAVKQVIDTDVICFSCDDMEGSLSYIKEP
jgi:hypothetical protein